MSYKSMDFCANSKVWEDAINNENVKLSKEICNVARRIADMEEALALVEDDIFHLPDGKHSDSLEEAHGRFIERANALMREAVYEWFRQANEASAWEE